MVTHSSILAWRIPWTEEPGRLRSMGWQKSRTQLKPLGMNARILTTSITIYRWGHSRSQRVKINCVVYLMIIEGKNDFIENHAQFYHYITGIEQGIKVSLTFPDCRLLVGCWPLGGPSLLMVLLIHSSTGFLKDSHHRNTRMMSYNYNRHSRT